ncbi:hypothetical protein C8F04DRAFT_979707 [Mycena alexandri]|uniref:DUF6589 domain-containing protein n=1 Tax=Mycena alexandri TaxID=1745969 RepID=A0AAD6RYM2_9AGAR|nr:hypothetical protein C8F04DRAFT_979707 [Mycena alexandri]
MSPNYTLRAHYQQLNSDRFDFDAEDAASTVGAPSSPPQRVLPELEFTRDVPFDELGSDDLPEDDSDDEEFNPNNARAPKTSDEDKTIELLGYMKQNLGRFSLPLLLNTLFTSDNGYIKNYTNMYLQSGGALHLMNIAVGDSWKKDEVLADCIIDKAADICGREASWLTDLASKGPNFSDAEFLRVKAKDVRVDMVHSFRIHDLLDRYERTLPRLQRILKVVIGKTEPKHEASRNPDMGRAMVTSMILNLRSRLTTYHGVMNSLMLWDNRASKKLVKVLNRYGFCTSYPFLNKSVTYLTRDSIQLAINVANNPTKLLLLPYDNFNWMKHAWEPLATHGSVTHDQVSALLVVFRLPPGANAERLASVENFAQTAGTRHRLPAHQALQEIMPNQADQAHFSHNSTIHVAHILSEAVKGWVAHGRSIPDFFDPFALAAEKDEEYFLPTFDQEQSSTRGNMLVMAHYFLNVLKMPKKIFEERFGFLLGDRLTTARARAAQDQRALDRSEDAADHLSSLAMLSGIMHICMNMINNIGKNNWGGADSDSVSLQTLIKLLPNRSDINLRKIDFYAWLRFLDVVLRALVLKAAMSVLNLTSLEQLGQQLTDEGFMSLCGQVTTRFLLPSTDCLEADGIKTIPGNTASGHAVLLMHDLMTLREMRHAVKHGHPERMERMLKYWAPMYYAGGGYNYANELMELLHNLKHDWPREISPILRGGMIMNNGGRATSFKETDIGVEQFNGSIKSHAHGVNARPALLEKITPALGHVQELTDQICIDLGIDIENKHHAKVRQDKDVGLILKHLSVERIFDFTADKPSQHAVIDLYRGGLQRLAGPDGGHAKRLRRHHLRFRTRHVNDMPPTSSQWSPAEEAELHDLERDLVRDSDTPYLFLEKEDDQPTGRWALQFHDNEEVELD